MSAVWQSSSCRTHTEKLVLLALADNANDEGVCWPSISTLARKCDLTNRSVIDQLESLTESGQISVEKVYGKVNHYTIRPVHAVHQCTPFTSEQGSPVPVNAVHGYQCTPFTGPVNAVHPNHKEPSVEPSVEPSREPSRECASLSLVLEEWNLMADNVTLPKCLVVSDKRRQILKRRLADPFFALNWKAALRKIASSEFCKGESSRGWRASFDWFIQPDSVPKIMEGKYDSAAQSKPERTDPVLRELLRL